ncbi:MAG: exopolysaccharide biosynthesis polyprenyl glycosylphosphotransferase [Oscillospiraceae bacterium]|nr:exopolysaccharide biosynthesis polyprenyl glycosylphosphotransferase [Oscillospiraceae bacterium]
MKKYGNIFLSTAKAVLLLILLAVFFIGQYIFYFDTIYYFWGNFIVLLIYSAFIYFTSRVYHGFSFGSSDLSDIILSWVFCLALANILQYLMLGLIQEALLPVTGFLMIFVAQIVLIIPLTILTDKMYYKLNPAQDAVIIYAKEEKAKQYQALLIKHRKHHKVSRTASQTEPLETLIRHIENSEAVFFLDVEEKIREQLLEYCFKNNKRTYILPTFTGVLINTAGISWISNTPMFLPKSPEPDMAVKFIKRTMDIAISLIAIVLTSWLMALTWLITRLYDKSPAIYKQVRLTKDGKLFTIYKFRSMRPDAEDDGVPRLTSQDDNRITPFGRFIRKTRLDELPQFFNVLTGSMSVVGPRPERPEIAAQYEEIYPNFVFRTKVKAGITGFAQIYGQYNTAPEDKLFLDIMYIENLSIWQDVKLLLQTFKVVFKSSSTEGVEGNSTTALK